MFKLPFKLALMKFQPKPFTKVKFIPRSIQHPLLLTGRMIAIWPHSLLVPVFDVDPKEGEAEDDAHGEQRHPNFAGGLCVDAHAN